MPQVPTLVLSTRNRTHTSTASRIITCLTHHNQRQCRSIPSKHPSTFHIRQVRPSSAIRFHTTIPPHMECLYSLALITLHSTRHKFRRFRSLSTRFFKISELSKRQGSRLGRHKRSPLTGSLLPPCHLTSQTLPRRQCH